MPITATGGLAAKLKKIREAPIKLAPSPIEATLKEPVRGTLDNDEELVQAEWDSLTQAEIDALSDQDQPEDFVDFSELVVDPDLPDALELDDESGPGLVDPMDAVDVEADSEDKEEELAALFRAYYRLNPAPSDDQFHALATSLGMDHETLEAALYKLVGDAVNSESVDTHEVDDDFLD